jgi:hypothetical protein
MEKKPKIQLTVITVTPNNMNALLQNAKQFLTKGEIVAIPLKLFMV